MNHLHFSGYEQNHHFRYMAIIGALVNSFVSCSRLRALEALRKGILWIKPPSKQMCFLYRPPSELPTVVPVHFSLNFEE